MALSGKRPIVSTTRQHGFGRPFGLQCAGRVLAEVRRIADDDDELLPGADRALADLDRLPRAALERLRQRLAGVDLGEAFAAVLGGEVDAQHAAEVARDRGPGRGEPAVGRLRLEVRPRRLLAGVDRDRPRVDDFVAVEIELDDLQGVSAGGVFVALDPHEQRRPAVGPQVRPEPDRLDASAHGGKNARRQQQMEYPRDGPTHEVGIVVVARAWRQQVGCGLPRPAKRKRRGR
jgi:hypothetical protein